MSLRSAIKVTFHALRKTFLHSRILVTIEVQGPCVPHLRGTLIAGTPPENFTFGVIVMKSGLYLSLCAAIAVTMGLAAPAIATPITGSENFILDTWQGSGSVSGNDFGTVSLTQNGANVDVAVTLTSGNAFVNTGAGDALLFDLDIDGLSVTNLTTGFAQLSSSKGFSGGGVGSFNYAIQCSSCGSGGSGVSTGPLDFTIDGINLADFQANKDGFYFASDICVGTATVNGQLQCQGTPGVTGNVTAETDPPGAVPEPITLSLFGAGLAGTLAMRRRRKKA